VPVQRVGINVGERELDAVLHLPDGETLGGAVALHGVPGDPHAPHIVSTCVALAVSGVAALRFAYRDPAPSIGDALADAAGAVRVLKAHPAIPERLGVIGFSFGGVIAALVAGRDSRVRAAVLAGTPAAFERDAKWKPLAELSRTRARVLLIRGSRDARVSAVDVERYAAVLSQARVTHQVVTIDGADHDFAPAEPRQHLAEAIGVWMHEALA
jgi:dienelactone hydrolase